MRPAVRSGPQPARIGVVASAKGPAAPQGLSNGSGSPLRGGSGRERIMQQQPLHLRSAGSATSARGASKGEASVSSSAGGAEDAVAAALSRANESLAQAETALDRVPHLPSATDPRRAEAMRKMLKRAQQAVVLVAVVASHRAGAVAQLAAALLGALCIGGWGLAKGSLSLSGAVAASLVGWGTLGSSFRFGAVLLSFFFSSSALTNWKEEKKQEVDEGFKKGGQRDWRQVLCNGLIPTLLAVAYGAVTGMRDGVIGSGGGVAGGGFNWETALAGAFLGYFACCCGDTWASEVGQLSEDTPRLITSGRPVRKGTNGGVTMLGMAASVAGGLFMGLMFWAMGAASPSLPDAARRAAAAQWQLVPLGLCAGLLGSVIDSVLGATVQFTGYNRVTRLVTSRQGPDVLRIAGYPLLDNNLVNLTSASLTAAATSWAALRLFG